MDWNTVATAANDIHETKETIKATAKTMIYLQIATGIIGLTLLIIALNKK